MGERASAEQGREASLTLIAEQSEGPCFQRTLLCSHLRVGVQEIAISKR